MKLPTGYSKYRDLLLAILLFIVLDLGILVFNYFASSQLERDAGRINAAGELRMLTQQITKAVLTLQAERRADLPIQTSMAQLSQGHQGFETSLAALTRSLGQDWEFRAFGLDPSELRDAVRRVEREWRPLSEAVLPVIALQVPAMDDVEIAVNKAVARNIKLALFSDDVATLVERAANTKTARMRQIQTVAIVLALLNFAYIVFKFLRRLSASDRVAEAARRETEDILGAVNEGLLLVRADGTLGGQFSSAVPRLFMREVAAGQSFERLLQDMLGGETAEQAADYVRLLLDPRVKPALLAQLDPLRQVRVQPPDGSGAGERHLSFRFTRVFEGEAVKELLVTVFDVTERVRLESQLAASRQAARAGLDDLVRVLEQDPSTLQDFLLAARERASALNESLREAGRRPQDYADRVAQAARLVHGIKGEASALGLSALAAQAHRMEDTMAPLRQRQDLRGEDLIPIAVELAHVQEQVDRLHMVYARFVQSASAHAGESPVTGMVRNLRALSERIAESTSKQVRLTAHVGADDLPPAVVRVLSETLPQLVRNAVVHGIEPPPLRVAAGKSPVGELRLELTRQADGAIEVCLSDDGQGIAVERVRQRAAVTRADAARMSDSQLLALIFDPAFSTAEEVTEHAGRGEGLALVRQLVEKAGARLKVLTRPNLYTRFVLQFQAAT